MAPKNIVVCCDGTSNQYTYDNTNVEYLYSTLVNSPDQVTFYHPGLGTMGPPDQPTKFDSCLMRVRGLAFGRGIEDDIRDAYVFLMQTYEPGDRVFLFGFSRGAYTARCLASMLHLYGLLRKGNEPLVPYAIGMMEDYGKTKDTSGPKGLARGFKATFSRECKVAFVGVWDTVSSVGMLWNLMHLPSTANNPDIAVGRHAVSIDEHRAFFRENLWWPYADDAGGPKDIKQVWFPGDHSDVGGGYPDAQSSQSKFALEWMLVEARSHGLLIDPAQAEYVLGRTAKNGSRLSAPGDGYPLHQSLIGFLWIAAEFLPKKHYDRKTGKTRWRPNLFRRRTIPSDAWVHESATLRADYQKLLPAGRTIEPRVPW